jgi:hypothetical protein
MIRDLPRTVPPAERAALLRDLSRGLAAEQLLERDLFPTWRRIHAEEEGGRARWLLLHNEGAALWVTVQDGRVVAHQLLEGEAALHAYAAHGLRFQPDNRQRIERALAPGADAAQALTAARPSLLGLNLVRTEPGPAGGVVRHYSVPGAGALVLEVRADGTIAGHRLLEGAEAVRLLRGGQGS